MLLRNTIAPQHNKCPICAKNPKKPLEKLNISQNFGGGGGPKPPPAYVPVPDSDLFFFYITTTTFLTLFPQSDLM